MRIAIFSDCYTPVKNGVVTSIAQLKAGLEADGHEVLIFTVAAGGHEDTEAGVIRFRSLPVGLGTELAFGFVNQRRVNRLIRESGIELIHSHTEFCLGVSAVYAADRAGIPRIQTTHTMWEEYSHYILNGKLFRPPLIRGLFRRLLRGASCIVAPSLKARNYYHCIVPEKHIEVVPNGLDLRAFHSGTVSARRRKQLRARWGIGETDRVILFVGRLGKEKRIGELLDTVLPVLRDNASAKMLIVGDGPLGDALRSTAERSGIGRQVIFAGYVDWAAMHGIYAIADVYATASTSEVHSMTLIEALMCSLAVVVRRDDAYLDSVHDGVNGYLAHSDEALGDYLRQLLQSGQRLAEFGRQSHRISAQYSGEAHCRSMAALYQRVLEQHRGGGVADPGQANPSTGTA